MKKQSVRTTSRLRRERPRTAPESAKPDQRLFFSSSACQGNGSLVSLHGKAEQLKLNAEKLRQSQLTKAGSCQSGGPKKGKKLSRNSLGAYVDRGNKGGAYIPGAEMGMGYNLGLTSPGRVSCDVTTSEKVTTSGGEIGLGIQCNDSGAKGIPKIAVPESWLEMAKSVGSTAETSSSSQESVYSTSVGEQDMKSTDNGELKVKDIQTELGLVQKKISRLSQQLCAHLSKKDDGDMREKEAMNGHVVIDDGDVSEDSYGSAAEKGKEAASSFLRDVPEVTSGQSAFVGSVENISPKKAGTKKHSPVNPRSPDGNSKTRVARLQHLVSQLKAARVEDAHKIDSLNRENEKLRSKLKHAALKAEKTSSLEKELELLRLSFEKSEKGRQAAKEYAVSLKKELDAFKTRSSGKALLSSGRPKSAQPSTSVSRPSSAGKRQK